MSEIKFIISLLKSFLLINKQIVNCLSKGSKNTKIGVSKLQESPGVKAAGIKAEKTFQTVKD